MPLDAHRLHCVTRAVDEAASFASLGSYPKSCPGLLIHFPCLLVFHQWVQLLLLLLPPISSQLLRAGKDVTRFLPSRVLTLLFFYNAPSNLVYALKPYSLRSSNFPPRRGLLWTLASNRPFCGSLLLFQVATDTFCNNTPVRHVSFPVLHWRGHPALTFSSLLSKGGSRRHPTASVMYALL